MSINFQILSVEEEKKILLEYFSPFFEIKSNVDDFLDIEERSYHITLFDYSERSIDKDDDSKYERVSSAFLQLESKRIRSYVLT